MKTRKLEGLARYIPQNRSDRRLAAVVAAWPELPEAIRAGILATVRTASKGDGR
jgi:hypothetical protein